jgi:hypothetical protein
LGWTRLATHPAVWAPGGAADARGYGAPVKGQVALSVGGQLLSLLADRKPPCERTPDPWPSERRQNAGRHGTRATRKHATIRGRCSACSTALAPPKRQAACAGWLPGDASSQSPTVHDVHCESAMCKGIRPRWTSVRSSMMAKPHRRQQPGAESRDGQEGHPHPSRPCAVRRASASTHTTTRRRSSGAPARRRAVAGRCTRVLSGPNGRGGARASAPPHRCAGWRRGFGR